MKFYNLKVVIVRRLMLVGRSKYLLDTQDTLKLSLIHD